MSCHVSLSLHTRSVIGVLYVVYKASQVSIGQLRVCRPYLHFFFSSSIVIVTSCTTVLYLELRNAAPIILMHLYVY